MCLYSFFIILMSINYIFKKYIKNYNKENIILLNIQIKRTYAKNNWITGYELYKILQNYT